MPLDGHIYTLTAGKVLNTDVFWISKVRLGSCLSTALKMENYDCTKINAHFKKFTACLWEGLIHKWMMKQPLSGTTQ